MQNQINFNRGVVRPIQAFNDAGELLRGNYGGFLGVIIVAVLIMVAGGFLPLAPLTPPMMCGIYLYLFHRAQGIPANTSTLFKGFDYFGQSFVASLVVSVPMMLISVVSTIILYGGMGGISFYIESLNLDKNPKPTPEEVLPVLMGVLGSFFGLIFLVIAFTIAAAFVLRMLVIFAYPLIVEYKMPGFEAVKLSIRALMGNFFGVLGLMILEIFLLSAGLMFFYIGVIFVLPFIHAAWFCAYRRVFAPQVTALPNHYSPQYVWTPQGTSKAGRNLILGAAAIFIFSGLAVSVGGFFLYHTITQAIEKSQIERKNKVGQLPNTTTPTAPTPPTTTNPNTSSDAKVTVIVSGGLTGQQISLVTPDYPPAAKAVKAKGIVMVKITVNESGNVVSASSITGHALLRQASELAARQTTFKPADKKREGILIYTYVPN